MQKISKKCIAWMLCIAMTLCSLSVSAYANAQDSSITKKTISLNGVQMRGADNGWYYYLILQSDDYNGLSGADTINGDTEENRAIGLNNSTLSKIRLYTSEEDTEGKALSDLTPQHIGRNFWSVATGAYINFAGYEKGYGGHQVYKATIEKGCEIYADTDTVFVVDKNYTFYNHDYGNKDKYISAENWTEGPTEKEISLTGVQMRGWDSTGNGGYYQYLVLLSDAYQSLSSNDPGTKIDGAVEHTSLDKIRLYTGAEDTEGTALSDLAVRYIGNNFWGAKGAFINYAEYDSTYGGHQVYKITVEKGCELWVDTDTVYVVNQDYTYYNNGYGNEEKKLDAVDWTGAEEVSLTGVQLRGWENDSWNQYLVLISDAYNDLSDQVDRVGVADTAGDEEKYAADAKAKKISTLDKIRLYTSANDTTGTALSDLEVGHIGRNMWGQKGAFINFAKYTEGYSGSDVFKIVIEKGCRIYADTNTVFMTDQDYTFYNSNYGNADYKMGATSWNKGTSVTVSGVQMRGSTTDGNWYYYLVLIADAYSAYPYADANGCYDHEISGAKDKTSLDKIRLYTSPDDTTGKALSDLTVQHIGRNVWNQSGLFINYTQYDTGGYGGSDVYKVTIEKGCELYADTDTVYIVDQDCTFYNGDYGNAEKKLDAVSWTGEYELSDLTVCRGNTSYSVTEEDTTINGTSYEAGNTFRERGTWQLSYKKEGNIYNRELVVWSQAEVDDEEGVDVRDLVCLVKNAKKETELSKHARMGADLNDNGEVEEEDAVLMRQYLIYGENRKLLTAYEGREYHITAESTLEDSLNELNERLQRYDELRNGDTDLPEASFNSYNSGWQSEAFLWQNATEEAYGSDKITSIYTDFLKTKTQDDYGYIYNQNDFREGATDAGQASWGTEAGGPQGWPLPTWTSAVEDPFSDYEYKNSYFASFDFNHTVSWINTVFGGGDDTAKYWYAANGTINIDGSGYALLKTDDDLSADETYRFYRTNLSKLFTKYGGIVGSQASFIELDMDFASENLADIRLVWQTSDGGDTWYFASASDYVTISDVDYTDYGSRSYWPMYLNENWNGKTITAIGVEFVPESGKTLKLTNAKINYLRPSYDTRQPQFAFQWMEAFYNYISYTRDEEALKELLPKARKVMLFLLHCLQGEDGLVNLDFFWGHNGIGTTINEDGSVTTHPGDGIASGYWDTLALSEINIETNAYFYTCLSQMAQIEAYVEKTGITVEEASIKNRKIGGERVVYHYTSDDLYKLMEKTKAKFSEEINPVKDADGRYSNQGGLWNSKTGRFALGINELTGEIVDDGYVLFNEQAIVAGLGTDEQRLSVMQWINGDRTVEGDLSTGSDIYFYEFAPRFTTCDDISQFNFALANLNFGDDSVWKKYGTLFSRQVQDGGAVLWASYYDLIARAQVLGTDNAYERLEGIVSWYNNVKSGTTGEGTTFFQNYYSSLETSNGSTGVYRLQGGSAGAGALGLDNEFLENVLFVKAIPDALGGMNTLSVDKISFTSDLPEQMDYLRLSNLKFGDAVYAVSMTKREAAITSLSGTVTKDMKVEFRFRIPEGSWKVWVDGKTTEKYVIRDGYVCVTVPFGKVKVKVE